MGDSLSAEDLALLARKDRELATRRGNQSRELRIISTESTEAPTTVRGDDVPAFLELLDDPDERQPTKAPMDSHVPAGENYIVSFARADFAMFRGRAIWYSHFAIIEPSEFAGWLLLRVWNVPEQWTARDRRTGKIKPLDKRSKAPRPGRSSNLFLDFEAVTGQRPRLRTFHPADLFAGVHLRVSVVDVGTDETAYSRIDRIVERVAGSSPARR